MIRGLITIVFILFFGSLLHGQSTRDVDPTPKSEYALSGKPRFESVQRESKKEGFFKRLFGGNKTEVEQFRENMRKIERRKRRAAKLAEKPQYSDPLYFGHKKPPVKRPPGKQKFCKECQMKH